MCTVLLPQVLTQLQLTNISYNITGAIYHGVIRPVSEANHWPSSCSDDENAWSYIAAAMMCLKVILCLWFRAP
jgi:hypothetical protein